MGELPSREDEWALTTHAETVLAMWIRRDLLTRAEAAVDPEVIEKVLTQQLGLRAADLIESYLLERWEFFGTYAGEIGEPIVQYLLSDLLPIEPSEEGE